MNLMEILQGIIGGQDPNQAISSQLPPQVANAQAQAAPAEAPGTAPQGVQSPVTYPQPARAAPQITQSPPDLANMYIELMRKNQNAQALDSGLNMVAAGFSKYPENRAALLNASGSRSGAMSLSAQDIINLQKQQQGMQELLLQKSLLGGLAKKYNMSSDQIQYLQSTGKLDEVMKHYATENLVQIEDKATGKTMLANGRTGQIVATLGGEKPEEGTWQDTPEGKKLVSSRAGGAAMSKPLGAVPAEWEDKLKQINTERQAAGKPAMTTEEFIKFNQSPGVNVYVSPDGKHFEKPPQGQDYVRNPDGSVKIDAEGKPTLYDISGSEAARKATEFTKEQEEADRKKNLRKSQAIQAASNVTNAAKLALSEIEKPGVVGLGSDVARTAKIGGMPHQKYDDALNTVRGNLTVKALNDMRAASPTGGALGNVTDFENRMLAGIVSPLGHNFDPAQTRRNIIRAMAFTETLAQDRYEEKDAARFEADLNARIAELEKEHSPKSKSGNEIRRIR